MDNLSKFYFLWGCLLSGMCGASLLHLILRNSDELRFPAIAILSLTLAIAGALSLEPEFRVWAVVIVVAVLLGGLAWI